MPRCGFGLACFLVLAAASRLIGADGDQACAVTQPSQPAFIPPAPYGQYSVPTDFWFGTPALWTIIHPGTWHLGVNDGKKLPYWRPGFNSDKEREPRLNVVARRLDGPAPLVWANLASGVKSNGNDTPDGMAMLTGLDIPTAGCWEISAHYGWSDESTRQWREATLAYTVRVEP